MWRVLPTWKSDVICECSLMYLLTCLYPSSIYSWFINLFFLLHSGFKSILHKKVCYCNPHFLEGQCEKIWIFFLSMKTWKKQTSKEEYFSKILTGLTTQTAQKVKFVFSNVSYIEQLYIKMGFIPTQKTFVIFISSSWLYNLKFKDLFRKKYLNRTTWLLALIINCPFLIDKTPCEHSTSICIYLPI